jgi:hypothetical protein
MAVLVEAISVIVPSAAIEARYPGGWEAFRRLVPNSTLCSDAELVRIGFMAPMDAKAFVDQLQKAGLVFVRNGKAVDVAVVDQLQGPTSACDWLEYGHFLIGDGPERVAACRLAGSRSTQVATPPGWEYARSLSAMHPFVPTDAVSRELKYLRGENGMDVYLNRKTGKEVYMGRTRSG